MVSIKELYYDARPTKSQDDHLMFWSFLGHNGMISIKVVNFELHSYQQSCNKELGHGWLSKPRNNTVNTNSHFPSLLDRYTSAQDQSVAAQTQQAQTAWLGNNTGMPGHNPPASSKQL